MLTLELDTFEIDHCQACGGVWLDSGELAVALSGCGYREDDEIVLRNATAIGVGKRRCPICRAKMQLLALGSRDSVNIDRCRRNHGLWFDRGELDRVIEHLHPYLSSPLAERLRSIFGM